MHTIVQMQDAFSCLFSMVFCAFGAQIFSRFNLIVINFLFTLSEIFLNLLSQAQSIDYTVLAVVNSLIGK
ncbi:hypothetical protein VIBNISO65_1180043 [Vibrio nigripulchritudo SO65]|nr:hypothetical protein VIBNIAM115_1620043 [Vibrio nigripulchritudo AM115]CCN43133.1 hypothetical protein VIBNIFTn2_490043 [Vibrio nigripulchritudo FTn2]CCN67905.1 hypothetical protein VIBNIPon4_90066 [Vibrio nigripulchritudo POn4]CCN74836.1 hypothetical protein VIBNISO65_1180043 [Vibrio nigripulchritudo SO65]